MPFRGLFKHKEKNSTSPPTKASSPKSTPFPSGLITLADGVDPVVDIVAVHGLNGHPEKTWTVDGVNWLRDLLPMNIENARILSWGYDANTHSSSQISFQYLYDHAKTLVADLSLKRRLTKSETRPIVFVAHSLGGIVVKSALIHSDAARQGALEKHRSIKLSTYGILFMGTPHQGGNGVPLGKLILNVASIFVTADDRILRHLERDSEWLQQQLGQYGPISGDFVTKFAYEIYPTPIAFGGTMMIVPQASAIVPGAVDAEPIAMPANHVNMVKFASREDEGYRKVSGHLQLLAEEAPDIIRQRWREEDSGRKARANSERDFSISFGLVGAPDIGQQFVGRKKELDDIEKALQGDEFQRKVVCLHGLGGIGKTQIAIEFAKKHQNSYTAAFWLNGKDEDTLKKSFVDIAKRLPESNPSSVSQERNADQTVEIVQKWLSIKGNTRWIMIFDNVDNPKSSDIEDPLAYDVKTYFPFADHGSILITTRSSRLRIGELISVKKLGDIQESIKILTSTSGRDFSSQDPDAIELIKKLDGLPLALATAGTYLCHVTTSLQDYLRYYHTSWLKLQSTTPTLSSYEKALYTTWNVSFEHIQAQNILAAKLLRLWAYFDHQDLWYQLLASGNRDVPDWFSELVDELSFNAAIRLLCDHALIERLEDSDGYGMHTCVHDWAVHVLNTEKDVEMVRIALTCVGTAVPEKDVPEYWKVGQRLLSHARQCSINVCDSIDPKFQNNENALDAIFYLGYLYKDQSKMEESEKMYSRALTGFERIFGAEHINTLNTVNNLGVLYADQGNLKKAEEMLLRALTGYEKILGAEHIKTLDTVNNLGVLYRNQGNLKKAEKMLLRALTGKGKIFGAEPIETLDTVNNLGILYSDQGNLKKAEEMYLRALTARERILSADHIKTLDTINNLGVLYSNQGNLKKAEEMYLRALTGYERILGAEHIKTLDTVNNLGGLYADQGNLKKAEEMYLRALTGYERSLDAEHLKTLQTVKNLGFLYSDQGNLKKAEEMYLRALTGYERILDAEHIETLDTINNLGILYSNQGNLKKAEEMYLRALTARERILGAEHIKTLDTVNNLGILYSDQGNLKKTEEMYLRALTARERILGAEHIKTLDTVNNLGVLYKTQGNLKKAEEMYLRALTGYEKAEVSDLRGSSDARYNLALLYEQRSMFEDAAKHFELAGQGYRNLLGPEHPHTVNALKQLEKVSEILSKDKQRPPLRSNG